MGSLLFYWIDRFKESFLLRYRKWVFLSNIKSTEKSLTILGAVSAARCKNIKIGKNVTIYPGVSFSGKGEIIIGNNVQIGEGTLVYSHNKIEIGSNVAIAGQCYIIDCNHGTRKDELIQNQPLEFDQEGLIIGSDVWVAAGCKIVKGAKIKNGAVIGAMSMVNSEIAEYGIAIGIPARVVRYRN
jgi:acetyltransferase-like isoleucine patch superfamily enzyme